MTTEEGNGKPEPLDADGFAKWLSARLEGLEGATATADSTMLATEFVNGELRPCVVAMFPTASYVITIAEVRK